MIDELIKRSRNVIPVLDDKFDNRLLNTVKNKAANFKHESFKFMNFRVIFSATFAVVIIALAITILWPRDTIPAYINDNIIVAKLVYNEVSKTEEDIIPVELDTRETYLSNEFGYSQIKVTESYYFKTIFDFQLTPYFKENHVEQEIEIVIAQLEILGKGPYVEGNWYTQEIIILKNGEEIVGFLSGYMGIIDDLDDEYLPDEGIYSFQSSNFLTSNAIVKYYEDGDYLYQFDVNISDPSNITVDIQCEIFKSGLDREEFSSTAVDNTFRELESDIVINLLEQVIIEKVFVVVEITEIDTESSIIYVSSDEAKSLHSIKLLIGITIYDQNGDVIGLDALKVGDNVQIYYFDRYQGYQPIDIYVNVIRIIE